MLVQPMLLPEFAPEALQKAGMAAAHKLKGASRVSLLLPDMRENIPWFEAKPPCA